MIRLISIASVTLAMTTALDRPSRARRAEAPPKVGKNASRLLPNVVFECRWNYEKARSRKARVCD